MAKRNQIGKGCGLRIAEFLVLSLALAGCGFNSVQVTGKVTYSGQPLVSGMVSFVGQDGRRVSSGIATDGAYKIDDPPLGPVKIAVASFPRVPPGLMNPGHPSSTGVDPNNPHVLIPERYSDPEESRLTYDVRSGSQTFNIDLKP